MENTQRPYEPSCEAIYCEYEQDAYEAGALKECADLIAWLKPMAIEVPAEWFDVEGRGEHVMLHELIEGGAHRMKR